MKSEDYEKKTIKINPNTSCENVEPQGNSNKNQTPHSNVDN
jgi:hypothetical protein|tara:strand:+ start:52 stop:174 length:123 start_codon:yes stop_codon:yes gene_type:complete